MFGNVSRFSFRGSHRAAPWENELEKCFQKIVGDVKISSRLVTQNNFLLFRG